MYYIIIGLGGACGAIVRVLLTNVMPGLMLGNIPIHILLVNILGCFLMGLLSEMLSFYNPNQILRSFLLPGFLGGFTTFSAFAFECGMLIEKHLYASAFGYMLLSVCFSLIGLFLGIKVVRFFLLF